MLNQNRLEFWVFQSYLVYIQRMSSVLTEFSDDVLNLKTKFFNARRELQPENEEQVEENNHRPKIHKNYPRSLVFTGKKQVERSEWKWVPLWTHFQRSHLFIFMVIQFQMPYVYIFNNPQILPQ